MTVVIGTLKAKLKRTSWKLSHSLLRHVAVTQHVILIGGCMLYEEIR